MKEIIILLLLLQTSFADIVELNAHNDVVPLGSHIEVLTHGKWEVTGHSIPNFGFPKDEQSARVQIYSPLNKKVFIEHRYVHTDMVTINGLTLGDRIHSQNQIIPHIYPVFPIELKKGLNTIHVKVQSQEIVTLPLFLHFQKPIESYWLYWLFNTLGLFFLFLIHIKTSCRASVSFIAYGLFFLFNHFLIEGMGTRFFPNVNWTWPMNEGYFLSAITYQLFLLDSVFRIFKWEKKRDYQIVLSTSFFILLWIVFLPYRFIVIPYFINAGIILIFISYYIIREMRRKNRKAIYFSLTWLPAGIGVSISIYSFLTDQYLHSFSYIYMGVVQIYLMFHFFLAYPSSCDENKELKIV